MLQSVYATKMGMTQAWTKAGKRLPVTKVRAASVAVVAVRDINNRKQVQLGLGQRKLERMHKPQRAQFEALGFTTGAKSIKSQYLPEDSEIKAGDTLALKDLLAVGDVVQVQGTSKGKGFAGVVKRYGFKGGPRSHGQSDRLRAPGSIGQGTTPGRVYKNKKMPGHMGADTITVQNLLVVHVDADSGEIWLSGPVPGAFSSQVKITKTGESKEIELNRVASHLPAIKVAEPEVKEVVEESAEEVVEAPAEVVEETPAVVEEAPVEEKTEA